MNTTHIPADKLTTNPWSGGLTTELFIYPPSAKYALRDFDFRVSTATVTASHSEFTPLPRYNRRLMVLAGETKLIHQNHHLAVLKPFDTDTFSGDWKTTSEGTCKDFNVMTRDNLGSVLHALKLKSGQPTRYEFHENATWGFVYAFKGNAQLGQHNLAQGDLLVIKNPETATIKFEPTQDGVFIIAEIH
jgi:environmental stress-induced protein Ves